MGPSGSGLPGAATGAVGPSGSGPLESGIVFAPEGGAGADGAAGALGALLNGVGVGALGGPGGALGGGVGAVEGAFPVAGAIGPVAGIPATGAVDGP